MDGSPTVGDVQPDVAVASGAMGAEARIGELTRAVPTERGFAQRHYTRRDLESDIILF